MSRLPRLPNQPALPTPPRSLHVSLPLPAPSLIISILHLQCDGVFIHAPSLWTFLASPFFLPASLVSPQPHPETRSSHLSHLSLCVSASCLDPISYFFLCLLFSPLSLFFSLYFPYLFSVSLVSVFRLRLFSSLSPFSLSLHLPSSLPSLHLFASPTYSSPLSPSPTPAFALLSFPPRSLFTLSSLFSQHLLPSDPPSLSSSLYPSLSSQCPRSLMASAPANSCLLPGEDLLGYFIS